MNAKWIAVGLLIESGYWDAELNDRLVREGDLDLIAEAATRLFLLQYFAEWQTLINSVIEEMTADRLREWRLTYLSAPHGPSRPPLLELLNFGRGRDELLIEVMRRKPEWKSLWLGGAATLTPMQAGHLRLLAQQVVTPETGYDRPPQPPIEASIEVWDTWLEMADRQEPAGLRPEIVNRIREHYAGAAYEDHTLRYRRALLAYHAEVTP